MSPAAILADVHARVVRIYEALEDGEVELAADVAHDLALELARGRVELEREAT